MWCWPRVTSASRASPSPPPSCCPRSLGPIGVTSMTSSPPTPAVAAWRATSERCKRCCSCKGSPPWAVASSSALPLPSKRPRTLGGCPPRSQRPCDRRSRLDARCSLPPAGSPQRHRDDRPRDFPVAHHPNEHDDAPFYRHHLSSHDPGRLKKAANDADAE